MVKPLTVTVLAVNDISGNLEWPYLKRVNVYFYFAREYELLRFSCVTRGEKDMQIK